MNIISDKTSYGGITIHFAAEELWPEFRFSKFRFKFLLDLCSL
jgi:hypothetical protein